MGAITVNMFVLQGYYMEYLLEKKHHIVGEAIFMDDFVV